MSCIYWSSEVRVKKLSGQACDKWQLLNLPPPTCMAWKQTSNMLLDEMPVYDTKCLILWWPWGLQIGVPFQGFPDYWFAPGTRPHLHVRNRDERLIWGFLFFILILYKLASSYVLLSKIIFWNPVMLMDL